uniref:Mannosyltransferase n=1 Tax=Leptobrachium leishanense TaxID=445787 RepID=A0A8C5MA14_9ANUR
MAAKALWVSLSILRIGWCLLPQSGYLHPDEFFQSPEVMAGDILNLDINRPWEFLPTSPCRTVVTPLLTSGAAFWIVNLLHHLDFRVTLKCSYILLVLPRLITTLLSFMLDYTVYHIAPAWGAKQWNAMVLLAGSYVTIVFYTRTLSNALEGIFLAAILLLTSPDQNSKAKYHHAIGIILVAGFFNRPTFAAFALIPILCWAGKTKKPHFCCQLFVTNVLKLLPSSLSTSVIFIAADTLWYKGWSTLPINSTQTFFGQIAQRTVFTPLNFLRYNLNPDNLAQHGSHPPVTHLLVNGVILFGVFHVSLVITGIKVLKSLIFKSFPQTQCKENIHDIPQQNSLLLLYYFVPIALLSLFSHQEPRFLIPLLLPLVLLVSDCCRSRKMTCVVVLFNLLGTFLFGSLQQGGLIPSLIHMQQMVQSTSDQSSSVSHYTILFTHTYMPPKYLLCLQKGQAHVDIIDLAGFRKAQLCQKIKEIKTDISHKNSAPARETKHHFVVVFPGTIADVVKNCGLVYKGVAVFTPHLSIEDPPNLTHVLHGNIKNYLSLHVTELEV